MFRFFLNTRVAEICYEDRRIDLILNREEKDNGEVIIVRYHIVLHGTSTKVGYCDLRLQKTEEMYYAGNIGYHIFTPYRGNGYAYDAARILLKIGFDEYGMDEIIITCSPDNIPSRCTIEKLGGELKETADVPENHWLAHRGELVKNIYLFKKNDWKR